MSASERRPAATPDAFPTTAATTPLEVRPIVRPTLVLAHECHVWADLVLVLGTRGLLRAVLIVNRCAFGCGRAHVHSGRPDFIAGKRKAGCQRGTYTVHALGTAAAA